MRRFSLLIAVTAMVFVTSGLAKGNPIVGPMRVDRAVVTPSELTAVPIVKNERRLSGIILSSVNQSRVAPLFVAAAAGDGDKNPPPRSTHCPPDKDDHHDSGQKGGDDQNKDNHDKDKDKDKDHHDDCGKGDDGKNP